MSVKVQTIYKLSDGVSIVTTVPTEVKQSPRKPSLKARPVAINDTTNQVIKQNLPVVELTADKQGRVRIPVQTVKDLKWENVNVLKGESKVVINPTGQWTNSKDYSGNLVMRLGVPQGTKYKMLVNKNERIVTLEKI